MPISAFLITFNEEDKIGSTLDSLKWTDEQIVVDGGSRDRTCEIAKEKGAKVFHRIFDNFENQKNYTLSMTHHEWVLSIDADEIVTPALRDEILNTIAQSNEAAGYRIKRVNYFLGKPLRFGGQGDERVLRLFQREKGRFYGVVHEEVQVNGLIGNLENILEHRSTETLHDYYAKLRLYTDLEAMRMVFENRLPSLGKTIFYPPLKLIVNYIFRSGFLDGWRGFLYHSLSCYYAWLKCAKARSTVFKKRVQNIQ